MGSRRDAKLSFKQVYTGHHVMLKIADGPCIDFNFSGIE